MTIQEYVASLGITMRPMVGTTVTFSPFLVEDEIMAIDGKLYAKDFQSAVNVLDWQNEISRLWPRKVGR
jgi:hypothetical protein